MFKNKKGFTLYSLVLASIILLVFAITSFNSNLDLGEDEQIYETIISARSQYSVSKDNVSIDLTQCKDVSWDFINIVTPYTILDDYIEQHDLIVSHKINTTIEFDDSIVVLLIVEGKEVISYVEVERSLVDFAYSPSINSRYSIHEAIWNLNDNNGWVFVE